MADIEVDPNDNTALLPGDGNDDNDEGEGPSNPFDPNPGGDDEGHEKIDMSWDPTVHDVSTSTRCGSW